MKRHACNQFPFFVVSLLLHVHPEMLNPPLRKMIWLSLLAQPSSPLTCENVDASLIPLSVLWACREEILIQCPTCHIVQIKRPSFASFGIDQGNTPGPLI